MAYGELVLEVADEVATVTLNRPEKLNALNRALQAEILQVCEQLKHDDGVRAVIFTGAGRGFCSGADISGPLPEQSERVPWQQLMDEDGWVGRQARAVYTIDKPTIAAVNGVAAGAGFSLALACDLRIGGEQARFKTVFIERNLSPDSGMSYLLPRIVGQGNALDLILTSRTVDAEEALRIGLLQRLVPQGRLLEEARAVARQIAAHPPIAAIMSRRVVQRSWDASFAEQLREEIHALAICRRAVNDAREQRQAFAEKRPPRFTGS
jgi:2-(1,2-epoxy-1,2-dihydrophenyl)acetyl-CoA isomerase